MSLEKGLRIVHCRKRERSLVCLKGPIPWLPALGILSTLEGLMSLGKGIEDCPLPIVVRGRNP